MSESQVIEIKMLIVGDSSVGKTCLLVRYFDEIYSLEKNTIGISFFSKKYQINSEKVQLQIFDTAGQDRYRSLVKGLFKGKKGFLVTYSIDDRKSFDSLNQWIKDIEDKCNNKNYFIMIIGNKCDIIDDRKVSLEEGQQFARKHGYPFFETSGKENINVNEAIYQLVNLCYKNIQNEKSKNEEVSQPSIKLEQYFEKKKKSRCCLLN